MKNKLLVIGYFGFQENQLDGQTIKTRNVFDLLRSNVKENTSVSFFDTQRFKTNKFSFLLMLLKIISCNKLVYIPAHNNLKYIFPLIFLLSKLFRIPIIYIVVGGWLTEYLSTKPIHVYFLSKIKLILPQSVKLTISLINEYNFTNIQTFPNFRIHNFVPLPKEESTVFKIVFMARVNRMKGLEQIFALAEYFQNYKMLNKQIIIDFYGPIDHNDKEYFLENVKIYPNTRYMGVVEQQEVHHVLAEYDIMVLPTKYYTEGFPGSILDAYISGIPVIVTKWKHADEFVDDGKTGFIVPFQYGDVEFIESVLKLYNNYSLLSEMKKLAYEKSKEYGYESAWKKIEPYLNS